MWNLAALSQHIKRLGPERQYLIEVVDSVGRGTNIFRCHLFGARDALNGFIDEDEPAGPKSLEHVLGASDQQHEYSYANLCSEAHLISCMHTVRNQWDIFAQLVNGLVLVLRWMLVPVVSPRFKEQRPNRNSKENLVKS